MDEQSQHKLNAILAKEPRELTVEEKSFLRARASYVGKKSRAKFVDIFNEKPREVEEITQEEEEEDTEEAEDQNQFPGEVKDEEEVDEGQDEA